jgi:hypothetical protein
MDHMKQANIWMPRVHKLMEMLIRPVKEEDHVVFYSSLLVVTYVAMREMGVPHEAVVELLAMYKDDDRYEAVH